MDVVNRINTISSRATAIGSSLWFVCSEAGVDYRLVWRWHKRKSSPTLRKFNSSFEKLDAAIEELERDALARAKVTVKELGARLGVEEPAP